MAYQISEAKANLVKARKSGDNQMIAAAKRNLNRLVASIAWGE